MTIPSSMPQLTDLETGKDRTPGISQVDGEFSCLPVANQGERSKMSLC
jgi:hypothetical protein